MNEQKQFVFIVSCNAIRAVFERLDKLGLVKKEADVKVPDPGTGDQTVLGRRYRVPTSFVGIMMMIQLCR